MIIGITGGIGSGKSYISRGLAKHGFVVYDCDKEAKQLIVEDTELKQQISALLGSEVYMDGKYQTEVVADKVFKDPTLLQQLNAIVHPAVKKDILNKCSMHNAQCTTVIESAILYESGLDKICDRIIAITAPEEVRLQRAIRRDKSDMEKVRARMRAQMSDEERARRADIVIDNDGTKQLEDTCQYILQHL